MKKIFSLLKACMTSDMNIFKIKQKKDNKKNNFLLPFGLSFLFMFAIWSNANMIFEKLAPMHLQILVISLVVFATAVMTIVEGIYKAGPLLFNCRDDQLLLSLPIKRRTILFVRMFKFYIFELVFNSLFIIPLIIAYLRWAEQLEWTFFLTSFVMILFLPVIPIVLSCVLGAISSSLSSRFKFKNLAQILISMIVIFGVFFLSYNMDHLAEFLAKHAKSINDFIMKLYYPAGVYAKLVSDFHVFDLLLFIIINIVIFVVTIYLLGKVYFNINSRLKKISTSKSIPIDQLVIKKRPVVLSLIKKELLTFFKTPVFIVNAGFSLVLYIIAVVAFCFKSTEAIAMFNEIFSNKILDNYLSIIVFILISFASFMSSITNSVISLEGRNISILKSLPIKVKTILFSKVLAASIITLPIIIGDIILFFRFRFSLFEMILLLLFAIIIPLVSHFIGLIINLKYPKLDWDSSAEVVKQSMSSFLSVMIGMLLFILSIFIVTRLVDYMSSIYVLLIFFEFYIILDIALYLYLIKVSVKDFNQLSI